METRVKIIWDKPEEQAWLCDGNIQHALSSVCKNTKFKVTELNELSGSEAVYGFCAWLTTQKDRTIMSGKHDCSNIADKIKLFCETNNLTDPKDHWEKNLIHPK